MIAGRDKDDEKAQPSTQVTNTSGKEDKESYSDTETTEKDNVVAKDDAGSGQLVATRISYNTGHGDFCFGRFVDRDRKVTPLPSGLSVGGHVAH